LLWLLLQFAADQNRPRCEAPTSDD